MKVRDKNCTDSKKEPATVLRDGKDESAQGKKSRVGREERKRNRGKGRESETERSDEENDRRGKRRDA